MEGKESIQGSGRARMRLLWKWKRLEMGKRDKKQTERKRYKDMEKAKRGRIHKGSRYKGESKYESL